MFFSLKLGMIQTLTLTEFGTAPSSKQSSTTCKEKTCGINSLNPTPFYGAIVRFTGYSLFTVEP